MSPALFSSVRLAKAIVLASLALVFAAVPARGDSTPAGDFSFEFSSPHPNAPSGLEFRQLYKHPDDPNAKPSPVRRFLFAAPEGSVFDGSAVPICAATDAEFQQLGRAACPRETVVGDGFITVMTGVPGEEPYPLDTTVFNSGDGIIELFTEQSTGAFLSIERPKFRGQNAFEDTDIAPTPGGPPDFQSAAREAYIEFPLSRGPDGSSFITTPPECGAGRRWTARFEWTNGDGNSYSNENDMRCVAPAAGRCALGQRGTAAGDSSEDLRPTRAGDSLRGRGGADRLRGRRGEDCLHGGRGDDRLNGNRDDDEVRGGPGADRLRGGRDRDRLSGGRGKDFIDAVDGERDRVACGGGRDTARSDPADRVEGDCERVRIKRAG